jgi:hypothetical protein
MRSFGALVNLRRPDEKLRGIWRNTVMTTYYVNYATGSDTNSGTQASPWKHAPGDSNATGNVKKTTLVGGDEVLFKGGVVY